jgi:toxin ParE1/3/4
VSGYLLSPAAQADLDQIWNYTYDRWDPDQAEVDVVRFLHRSMDVDRHL